MPLKEQRIHWDPLASQPSGVFFISESGNNSQIMATRSEMAYRDGKAGDKIWINTEHAAKHAAKSETRTMPTLELKDSIAFGIGAIPDVEAVFTLRHDNVFYIWTVVDQSEPEIRSRIYEREKQIIDQYASLDFDFNIVASRGRKPQELIGDPAAELTYVRS